MVSFHRSVLIGMPILYYMDICTLRALYFYVLRGHKMRKKLSVFWVHRDYRIFFIVVASEIRAHTELYHNDKKKVSKFFYIIILTWFLWRRRLFEHFVMSRARTGKIHLYIPLPENVFMCFHQNDNQHFVPILRGYHSTAVYQFNTF